MIGSLVMRKVALATVTGCGAVFLGFVMAPAPLEASSPPATFLARSELRLLPDARPRLDVGLPQRPMSLALPPLPSPPPPPPPPTPTEALRKGVLIVVSLASQQAFVFKNGELWDSTQVSTGKRGKETPEGVFPILQKKVHHLSSLYDDAPMPYMQRLTWDGIALHAGRVSGYPASHGCIRLPAAFAKKLYEVTGFSSTIVLVTEAPVQSAKAARELA